MSEYRNGILDITENFANVDYSVGYFVNLNKIIVLPGKYTPDTNKISLKGTDISLEYESVSYIDNSNIVWNKFSDYPNGISIVILKQTEVLMNNELRQFQFLFFDTVSTFAVGQLTLNQGDDVYSIEICQCAYQDLERLNRSEIKEGLGKCSSDLNFKILPNYLRTTSSPNSRKPVTGFTICIDPQKFTPPPACPINYDKCWNDKNEFQNGKCYDPKTNTNFYTYCMNEDCFKPKKIDETINTWWAPPGSGKHDCKTSPDRSISVGNKDISVNELIGRGISNLREGTNKMVNNTFNLRNKIIGTQQKIEKQKMDIHLKTGQIKDTQQLIDQNKNVINKKMQILESRNKQLELSIDRNIYWKKVLYVLFAIIIIIIVVLLFLTSFLKNSN